MFSNADVVASTVASQQLGLLTVADLIESGLSYPGITRRVQRGLLVRRKPAIYSYAGTPSISAQRLVIEALSIDARAAISHDSAAHLWSLTTKEPESIHVVVRRWRREHSTSATVHESLDFVPKDRVLLNGIPTTSAARTAVDLGATSPWLVESAVSRGVRESRFTVEDLDRFVARVARRGRSGVGVIRPILELHRAIPSGTESVLEDRFLRVLFDRGIRLPMAQHEVVDDAGRFICRADFAFPDVGLLIELDGRAYHSDQDAFQNDRRKQNQTQALGWIMLRFTWSDVTDEPDRTATVVDNMLSVLA